MGYDTANPGSGLRARSPFIDQILFAHVYRLVRYTTLYRRPSSRTVICRQSEYARLAVEKRARRAISPDIHTRSIDFAA